MIRWRPDFCPTGQCIFELDKQGNFVAAHTLCPHHDGLGLTALATFNAAIQSSRVKERARTIVREQLALPETPPYTVGSDGNFTIASGLTGPARTALRNAVTTALSGISQPAGTSTVTIG
jgi:hypothetical protein